MQNSKLQSTLSWANSVLILLIRVAVGGIFILSGLAKLAAPIQEFVSIAKLWEVIPDPWVTIYAMILPGAELAAGIMLLIGLKHKWASWLIGLMLVSFLIGIGMNLIRNRELENCGCFGSWFSLGETFKELWWRDWMFLIATAWVGLMPSPLWLSVDAWLTKGKS